MTFTYDSAAAAGTATALHNVRLEIGDTDSAAALFTDEEIGIYLAGRGSAVLLTAADLCDQLATRFSRAYDLDIDGQSFSRSQMVKAYQDRAKALRARAGGVLTIDVTKVDGYSQDVPNQDTLAAGSANPRQRFYNVGGLDRLP